MSCEIKLRCANITTIYVSRSQNQTVSDVILQVVYTCNQNLGSTNSFIAFHLFLLEIKIFQKWSILQRKLPSIQNKSLVWES